jgi:hypothetical protein
MPVIRNQVRQLRAMRNMTQQELADQIGVTRQTVSPSNKTNIHPRSKLLSRSRWYWAPRWNSASSTTLKVNAETRHNGFVLRMSPFNWPFYVLQGPEFLSFEGTLVERPFPRPLCRETDSEIFLLAGQARLSAFSWMLPGAMGNWHAFRP